MQKNGNMVYTAKQVVILKSNHELRYKCVY